MKGFISKFLKDESGAAAAEYALILAIVTVGIAVTVGLLASAIDGAIADAEAVINPPAAAD